MRVLHIITGLSTGGAEKALFNLLSGGLTEMGETVVLSLSDEGSMGRHIRALGVHVMTLGMKRGLPTPAALLHLRRIVRDFRPDLIQGWMYHGNLAASMAKGLAINKPAVIWNVRHSLYSLSAEKLLTRQVIRANRCMSTHADTIIYNSRVSRCQHEAFGFAGDKGKAIANGFDTTLLQPAPAKRKAVRQSLGIEADEVVVGHVARFHPVKNHAGFLQAAVQVLKIRPEVSFLLVGRNVGLDNPSLSGIVPSHLQDRFRFVGERADVADLMQVMDVFCLTSTSEAFPNVLAEAMSIGLPCVATDVGDSRDIVGNSGLVVAPGNVDELARGLLTMLSKTIDERCELGRTARVRVEQNYALPAIVLQYANIYREITD